jgi:hypothetical protein
MRPDFIDTREVPYVMPAFTEEEEKLLGLRPYSAAEMAATDAVLARLVHEAASGGAGGAGRAGGVGGTSGAGMAQKRVAPASKASQKASASATESDSDDDAQAGPPLKKAAVQYGWECRMCLDINGAQARACAACDTPRASSESV